MPGSAGRPRLKENEVATEERLLLAAEEEFARRGFDGAHLHAIAERVGISRPSLLYHFGSKRELYAAVVRTAIAQLGDALEGALETAGTFEQRFDAAVRGYLGFLKSRPGLATVLLRELLDARGPVRDLLLEAGVPVLERFERFIEHEGRRAIRGGLPIREAMLLLVAGSMIRAAAGPLEQALWGKTDRTAALARTLFFQE